MRKKNQTRKWKKKHSSYSSDSSDSSIPPSSSSGYSPDLGNARARIRAKENDNYKKKIKRPRCSHSPGRDRTKSKRRKLEGSVRKGGKSKLKEKRKRKKNEKLKQRVRDTSVSSDFTPRSQSCSTCRSSSSGDICKGRSSKARSLSRSKKNKKYNDRGRSRSPINSSSDDSISSHRLERIGEKSSLRMSKEAERGYNFDTKVGSMEVSTKDHGNFLSSKRNGSFDGLNGRESVDALERYAGTDYCVGEEKEASNTSPGTSQVIISAALYLKFDKTFIPTDNLDDRENTTRVLNMFKIPGDDVSVKLMSESGREDIKDLVFVKPLHVRINLDCADHPLEPKSGEIISTDSNLEFNVSL